MVLHPIRIQADTLPQPISNPVLTKSDLIQKVYQYAKEYDVSGQEMINLINCEDTTWDVNQQSTQTYKSGNRWGFPAGTREKSYGLAQIHLPDHNQITYAEATDPDFSLNFMASTIAKEGDGIWSCSK